jgi:hypothetical protein
MQLTIFAALSILSALTPAQESIRDTAGNEPATFIEGSLKLQNGLPIRYTYYFDHSGVKSCVRAGNSLIVLTESGNLVRFDAESLRMTGQQIVRGRATAITVDDRDHILIGTEDGKISEVDPATLEQTTVARANGRIEWLASVQSPREPGRMIVATVYAYDAERMILWPGETDEHLRARSPHRKPPRWNGHHFSIVVYINGRRRSFRLPRRGGGPMLLEGSGRLWLGANAGEWGGACGYLDLQTGKGRTISTRMLGVEGFLRTQDGRMLVYGGTNHMFVNQGFVASIEGDRLKYIREFEAHLHPPAKPGLLPLRETDRQSPIPQGPLDLITTDVGGQGFWVLSENILYHANASFTEWTKPIDLDYGWDKGGTRSWDKSLAKWLILDSSRPREMIAVMTHGGFVWISQGRAEPHPSPGQLHALDIRDVWNTSIGMLFMEDDNLHSSWLLDGRRWGVLRLCSDLPPSSYLSWNFAEPFGDDGSGIFSFCADNLGSGGRYLVKVRAPGTADFKSTWQDVDWSGHVAFLMTSERETLRIQDDKVWIQEGQGWNEAGHNTVAIDPDQSKFSVMWSRGRRFVHLERVGRTEIFLDVEMGNFVQLIKKPDGKFEFTAMDETTHAVLSGVFDAVADGDGWLQAATGPGLLRFDPENGKRQSIPSPKDSKEIISLCRDGQGRLWAASSDHVYLSPDEGTHWESLDLPMLSYVDRVLIRPNPQGQNGIVLTMSDRGVVFLEW